MQTLIETSITAEELKSSVGSVNRPVAVVYWRFDVTVPKGQLPTVYKYSGWSVNEFNCVSITALLTSTIQNPDSNMKICDNYVEVGEAAITLISNSTQDLNFRIILAAIRFEEV